MALMMENPVKSPMVPPTRHTDPELQAIVQGLEVSSPWFRAVFGVLFCGYDVSQGLRGYKINLRGYCQSPILVAGATLFKMSKKSWNQGL